MRRWPTEQCHAEAAMLNDSDDSWTAETTRRLASATASWDNNTYLYSSCLLNCVLAPIDLLLRYLEYVDAPENDARAPPLVFQFHEPVPRNPLLLCMKELAGMLSPGGDVHFVGYPVLQCPRQAP